MGVGMGVGVGGDIAGAGGWWMEWMDGWVVDIGLG